MSNVPRRPTERRRRNVVEPAKADRALPAGGRRGRPPSPPVPLGAAGSALWSRLWASPQATTWSKPHHDGVALRCRLEDMLVSGEHDPARLLPQIQAWEDRWGFNPRSLAQLHMWIEGDGPAEPKDKAPAKAVTDIRDRMREIAAGQ